MEGMLCHNNNTERPFAVLRSYKRIYPSISIRNSSKLSETLVSGLHLPPDKGQLAGVALTADPRLRACIGSLCGVRKVKVGKITQRKRKACDKYDTNVREKTKKAAWRDRAEEIAFTSLVNDHSTFQTQLLARGNSSKAKSHS